MKPVKRFFIFGLPLVLLVLPVLAWAHRQSLYDFWQLQGYDPPARVVLLADSDAMTDLGRRIFYVNHPQLIGDNEAFHDKCPVAEKATVLGCYYSIQAGIFVYDVKDERLAGVHEVTAAHELLHAAYDRLSTKERQRIDNLLTDYYEHGLTDARVRETINLYKTTEPNDVINEMHSVFGSAVAQLPQELEDHYKLYFSDRSKVVTHSQNYVVEFTNRKNKISSFETQLNSLQQNIDNQENQLKAQQTAIEAESGRLDALRASGQIDEYDAGVPAYNASIEAYKRLFAQHKKDIDSFNKLVEEYNLIAGELRALYSAIDSSAPAQPNN